VSQRPGIRVVAVAACLELALAVMGIALGAIAGVGALDSFSWDPEDAAIGVLATLPLLVVFRVAWRSPAAALQKIRAQLERLLSELFADTSTVGLAVVSLAAGIGEEILFRGFVQGWLESMLGTPTGLAAASLLFGAAHPISTGYVAIATIMGAYLGALYLATENLLAPIVTHALYDLVVLRLLLRSLRR
jgi:membrane protease YdiL (CAAX protease family)